MVGEYYPPFWTGPWPFNTPITIGEPYVPSWTPPPPLPSPFQFPMLLPAFWGIGIFAASHISLDEDRNDEFPECYP